MKIMMIFTVLYFIFKIENMGVSVLITSNITLSKSATISLQLEAGISTVAQMKNNPMQVRLGVCSHQHHTDIKMASRSTI